MDITFHILTDTPVSVNVNNNWYKIDGQKIFSLQESITYNFMIFFDSNNKYCPFAFSLNNEFSTNSNQVEVFKLNSSNVFLKISPTIFGNQLLFEDDNHQVFNGYATYYNHTKLSNGRFYATNCKKIFDNGKKIFDLVNDNEHLLIGVNDNKVLFTENCNMIEIDNDNLTILKNTFDIFNHGIVSNYSLKSFELIKNYSVYMSSAKNFNVNFSNICPLFIQSGIGLNKNLCLSFVGDDLKQNFSLNSFQNFFGKIDYFYQYYVSPDECKVLIKTEKFKTYTFKLKNNKIIDIE